MSTDTDNRARAGYAGCPQCNGTRRTLSNSGCYTCGWVDTLLVGQRETLDAAFNEGSAAATKAAGDEIARLKDMVNERTEKATRWELELADKDAEIALLKQGTP